MIDEDIFNTQVDFNGSKGLVFVGEKIIVCRRDDKTDKFPLQVDLPGGGREEGESPFETFKREIKEELNLDIEEKDVQYAKKYRSIHDNNEFVYFIVIKSSKLSEKDIIFGNEGTGYFLVSPLEFINLKDGIKWHQEKVADYLNFIF